MNGPPTPSQRVSAIPFPDAYALPKPAKDAPQQSQDAHRQTQFLLGDDLRLIAEGMTLQLRVVRDASPSSFRNHPYAALMGLWSRTYLALADGCQLAMQGSYPSCPALVRAACELIAAQHQLQASEMELFLEWLVGSLVPNEEHKATDIGLGHYFAGEALAADERLRLVYRPASELGRPNFGATLLEVGPESNNRRLALGFGERLFHLGWAEIVFGWLLALCERQLAVAVHAKEIFPIHEETHRSYADYARSVEQALAKPGRCRIDEISDQGERRFLVENFRRAPSGEAKRVLL